MMPSNPELSFHIHASAGREERCGCVRVLATTFGCPPFLLIRAKEASPNSFNNIISILKRFILF